MAQPSRRNRIIAVVLLLLLLLLLLVRCQRSGHPTSNQAASQVPVPASQATSAPQPASTESPLPAERLTPAVLQAPVEVAAGAVFSVAWTGPDNPSDYLALARLNSPDDKSATYVLTREGSTVKLTAPIEAGSYEVRYVAARSHTILGRAPVTVLATAATLSAAGEVWIDTPVSVSWSGPANPGDYITLVAADQPDGKYGHYTKTDSGSPLMVTAPAEPGDGELRYLTGQGGKILARRPIRITLPPVNLHAADEAVAGTSLTVTWSGPGNSGDYITVVSRDTADGRYGNYATLGKVPTVTLTLPMTAGDAELRYMTGGGAKVIGRRSIRIVAAQVTLSAPERAQAGSPVTVSWTGPANQGDYITIVTAGAPEGKYGPYTMTGKTSPLVVTAPKETGASELRYISGQGALTLARRPILITD